VAHLGPMMDPMRKKAILDAEADFERKENLARALAESGVTLIGRITSKTPPPRPREGVPR
jgi:hypothetical protein